MATTTDYDAPRTTITAGDSMEKLQARRGAAEMAAVDADENDLAAAPEFTGSDLDEEEFTVAVVPMMADEFRCTRCFLVWHRSQRATAAPALCRDCS
ncbi:MAG TPA: DUF4193 family protein [Candidatus Limnocylindrales bacterium]